MIFSDAYAYVARALSRSTDTDRQESAKDAIKAAVQEWNLRRDWKFLLLDTSNGFTVAGCSAVSPPSAQILTTVSNGFVGVNINQTVSGTGITAGSTVVSIDSGTQITISTTSSVVAITLTFGADIPVRVGVDTYNLPTPIKRAHSVRLITNERTLTWKDMREIDRVYLSQTGESGPRYYNHFNDESFTTARQYGRLRLFPIPGFVDTCRVRYHRPIAEPSADADILDMPDRYVYSLLTLARYYFLILFDSEMSRVGEHKERAEMLFRSAVKDDQSASIDRDVVMVPYIDWGFHRTVDGDEVLFD